MADVDPLSLPAVLEGRLPPVLRGRGQVLMKGEYLDVKDLHRFLRDQEQREIRRRDDLEIYQRGDGNRIKALAERMVYGRSARKKLLEKVAPLWTQERRRA